MAKTKRKCKNCNKWFEAENKEINRGNGLFCSLSCSNSYSNKQRPVRGRKQLTHAEKVKRYGKRFIIGQRLQRIKKRAKQKRIPYSLSTQDVLDQWNLQGGRCYYSGRQMTLEGTKGHKIDYSKHMSIDRVDFSKGYTVDNIVLCTQAINTFKSNLTLEELKRVCRVVIGLLE